jgi:hypothetical protein
MQAQSSGTLRGTVTDPSGAAVVGATVTVTSSSGQATTATSNATGAYEVRGLAAGQYQVTTNAPGFQQFQNPGVAITAGQAKSLDIPLTIQEEQQQVQVNAESQSLDVSPENNASSIVMSGSDLDALPDDPDELQADLQALAGPSLGPNGGQMYIDGFTAGELPPKSQIREIRINSNPFSAQYDSLGYGRIEIFTKAGGGQTHGSFFILGNTKGLNTGDPYVTWQTNPVTGQLEDPVPPYYTVQYNGNIGGSLGKNTSYFVTAQQRRITDAELGNLYDPTTATAVQSGLGVTNPRIRTQIAPQIAFNPSKNNTLTFRYQYSRDHEENDGISPFVAPTASYNTTSYENSLQVSDTQVYGANLVMDTRFQFNDEHGNVNPLSTAVGISVPGYVTLGGASQGFNSSTTQNYELQNYFTFTHGKHTLNFGVRWRDSQSDATETPNANGSYSFQSIAQFQAAQLFLNANPGQPVPTADLPYQYTQTLTSNGGYASINVFDAGGFIQDDYKWKPNVTISTGLRFEAQTDIPDHRDWAPREAIAWGLGKTKTGSPAFVVRGGWGMFYNRFSSGNLLTLTRNNGVAQVNYLLNSPGTIQMTYPNAPQPSELTTAPGTTPTIYRLSPNFHVPYTMEAAASIEHQLTRNTTITVNYLNGRGVKQLYTTNVNAPSFASDFNLTNPADRPNGVLQNINQYTSGGVFKQNVLSVSFNIRASTRLTLNGYYSLTYANATAGNVMFWQDPSLDYGRASFAPRNRVFVGGNWTLPYGFSLSPFVTGTTGSPYNITGSNDWTGNALYNRPTFTEAPTDGRFVFALPTSAGTNLCNGFSNAGTCMAANGAGPGLTLAQIAQVIVPVNYLTGPGNFSFNLRVAKVFSFGRPREATTNGNGGLGGRGGPGGPGGPGGRGGPGGGGPGGGGFGGGGRGGFGGGGGRGGRGGAQAGHRYTLTLSANARNLFNIVNPGTPQGSDNSIYFTKSTGLAQAGATTTYNRQVSLQAVFSF